ncbi:MAG: ABC transporter permease [Candidatus Bathyarchaeota archaeon]|nr:ABC transporter permease [Candidatus Bathyarchaeota archaeon]
MKLKRTINQVFAIAKTDFLGIARNKTAIFFTLIFPLFFLMIIGFTFGTQGTGETGRIRVGTVNLDAKTIYVNGTASQNSTIGDAFVQALKDVNFTVYEYDAYGDKDANGTAAYDISREQIKIAVVIPANFTETLSFQYTDSLGMPIPTKAHFGIYTDPSDPTGSIIAQQSILGFISGFIREYQKIAIDQIPESLQGYAEVLADPITVSTIEADVSGRQLRWIDYMVPGTLGLVLLWSGLNHASVSIASERTKGTFQRMIIAPVSPVTVLAGKVVSCLAIVYLSASIMLASGILLFQVNLYWNIPAIVLSIFLGALSAIGLGLIISSLAKNEEAANSVAVLISVPLQFFIGAFFPLSIMPQSAQIFGEALPFTKLVNAMQGIMTKNLPFEAIMPEIVYMSISGMILFALGVAAYRLSLKRL